MRTTVQLTDAATEELIGELARRDLFVADLRDKAQAMVDAMKSDENAGIECSPEAWTAMLWLQGAVDEWDSRLVKKETT